MSTTPQRYTPLTRVNLSGAAHTEMVECTDGSYVLHADYAPVAAELTQIKAVLADPAAVYVNMLRGNIARPTVSQMRHLIADRQYEVLESRCADQAALLEDATTELRRLLDVIGEEDHAITSDILARLEEA